MLIEHDRTSGFTSKVLCYNNHQLWNFSTHVKSVWGSFRKISASYLKIVGRNFRTHNACIVMLERTSNETLNASLTAKNIIFHEKRTNGRDWDANYHTRTMIFGLNGELFKFFIVCFVPKKRELEKRSIDDPRLFLLRIHNSPLITTVSICCCSLIHS